MHINTVKTLADQLHSIKVNSIDEDVYMVLLMSLPPIRNNLKTSKKWNEAIVLTNKKSQRLYSSNATITKLWLVTTNKACFQGSTCAQNHERREWKTTQNHSIIYYLLTLK
jgi:hypothetical protein